jgi:hypothetical protein
MARRRWFYSRRGKQHGPFKGREIAVMVEDREIQGSDLLWAKGRRPRPAASYRKLFRRRPSARTRYWVTATACISTLALLLSFLLSPGSELAELAPDHLRGVCLVASVALAVIAVTAPGVCAIAIDSTYIDVPTVTVLHPPVRPKPASDLRAKAAAADRLIGVDATIWATPHAMSWGVAAAQEFASLSYHRRRLPRPFAVNRRVVAVAALVLVGLAVTAATRARGPFRYELVRGSVAYTDGTKMQIASFQLRFHPLARPRDAATRPPIGTALVDGATGEVLIATTEGWPGIMPGRHKVTVHAADGSPLPEYLVSKTYADPSSTLLMVDTAAQPFSIHIENP